MWFFFALAGFAVAAVVNILDKFVLDKTVRKPVVLVFYSTIFVLPILLLIPWNVGFLNAFDYLIAILAGLGFLIALWAGYTGIQKSEISHMGPFIGATIPIFTFLFGGLFLSEQITSRQLLAIILLILGSLIIAFEKSRRNDGFHKGMLWGVLAGLLWSIYGVSAKYLYGLYGFYTGFVWIQGALGIAALFLLFLPAVRQSVFKLARPMEVFKKDRKKIGLVASAKTLGVIGLILVQYAIALGSVTLVYALAGVQYAILIILVALLSKFYSRFFKEEYTRAEIIQEILAILIIGAGLALMVC